MNFLIGSHKMVKYVSKNNFPKIKMNHVEYFELSPHSLNYNIKRLWKMFYSY